MQGAKWNLVEVVCERGHDTAAMLIPLESDKWVHCWNIVQVFAQLLSKNYTHITSIYLLDQIASRSAGQWTPIYPQCLSYSLSLVHLHSMHRSFDLKYITSRSFLFNLIQLVDSFKLTNVNFNNAWFCTSWHAILIYFFQLGPATCWYKRRVWHYPLRVGGNFIGGGPFMCEVELSVGSEDTSDRQCV